MAVTLIWHPSKSKQLDPNHPALNCPVRFPVLHSAATGKKNSNQELEVQAAIALTEGSNLVEDEIWQHMQNNPFVQRFIESGLLHVIEPKKDEGFVATGTTLDFSEVDARTIVSTSLDIEWLQTCIQRETRDPIVKACKRRIQEVESSARKMAAAAIAQGVNS